MNDSKVMTLSEQKKQIRNEVLAKRNQLDAMRRIEMSLEACKIALRIFNFEPGTIVSGFFPIRSEIDIRPLIDDLSQGDITVCLPAIIDKTTLEFRELTRACQMQDTGFGTRGPGDDARILEPDVMFVPMSAFDLTGGRIGYGAGYYDRAIEKLANKNKMPKLLGAGFAMQQVDHVPIEKHDMPLDGVLTELEYIDISKEK